MLSIKNKIMYSEFVKEKLVVKISPSRTMLGENVVIDVVDIIHKLHEEKKEINIVFAAAPSQLDFLDSFTRDETIQWNRINAFHMDEYIGLPSNSVQSFGNFLKENLFDKVPFKNVYYINGKKENIEQECSRYSKLIQEHPIDIVCLGIGENGHIAFNDPPVADFNDPIVIKVVKLELACRQQQVNEKCFENLDEVPKYALSLTIPALLKAKYLFCIVPASNKAIAVYNTLNAEICEMYPSTILRKKENTILYLDEESSNLLKL
jgi:glucosamine-6-phosphate deaminase